MDAPDPLFPAMPLTQDELPYDDGEPLESEKHRDQMFLLIDALRHSLPDRPDVFVGGNMALYYSVLQAKNNDFRAPDFFVVLHARLGRERKSWVVWEEESRTPDVVVELLSESTERVDRGRKMQVYAGLKVREYYLFDPHDLRLEGYTLEGGEYRRMAPRPDGDLDCAVLGLRLGVVEGTFLGLTTPWLRWKSVEGVVVPTAEEMARSAQEALGSERARSERLEARLRALGEDPAG